MPTSIAMKATTSFSQLTQDLQSLLSVPALLSLRTSPYIQFELLGLQFFIHSTEVEERAPEVQDYPLSFSLQHAYPDHLPFSDELEERLLLYYAHYLTFHLPVEIALEEKRQVGSHWQIRYVFYRRNPRWREQVLYGEEGWEPAILQTQSTPWRTLRRLW